MGIGMSFSCRRETEVLTGIPWRRYIIVLFGLLVLLLAGLFAPSGLTERPREAAPATLLPQATIRPGAARTTPSPRATIRPGAARTAGCTLGDINCDGIVEIRDYGIWRQQFGATDCGNPADLNGDCIVDIRDYGIWRANFGQTGPTLTPTATATPTATPTLPVLVYVANQGSNSV